MQKAQKENFRDFFKDYGKGFKIPIYQRPYSWKKENVEIFLNDIEGLTNKKNIEHFFGLIVLSIEKAGKKHFFDIIDGQQRVTTVLITLSIIRDFLRDIYLKKEFEIKEFTAILKELKKLDARIKELSTKEKLSETEDKNKDKDKSDFDEGYEYLKKIHKELFDKELKNGKEELAKLEEKFLTKKKGQEVQKKKEQALTKNLIKDINVILKDDINKNNSFRFKKHGKTKTDKQKQAQQYLYFIFTDLIDLKHKTKKSPPSLIAYSEKWIKESRHDNIFKKGLFSNKTNKKIANQNPQENFFLNSMSVKKGFMEGCFKGDDFNLTVGYSLSEYKNYKTIYDWFWKKINEKDPKTEKTKTTKKKIILLEKFYKAILEKLEIIRFVTEDHEQAFNMFEVLNARGLAVSATDLIKNICLKQVPKAQIDKTFKSWDKIFKSFSSSSQPVQFLRYYYNSFQEFISKNQLFSSYKTYLKNIDVDTFLEELGKGAKIFNKIRDPQSTAWKIAGLQNTDVREKIVLLNYTKTTQWYSLALSVFKAADKLLNKGDNNEIKSQEKLLQLFNIVFELQSCLVLNNVSANKLETKYPELAKKFSSENIKNDTSFRNAINKIIKNIQKFQKEHTELSFKSINRDKFLTFFSKSVDARMILAFLNDRGSLITISPSLEHVLPQNNHDEWLWVKSLDEEVKENFINNPGNLLLLDKTKNSSLKAKGWKGKKEELQKWNTCDPTGLGKNSSLYYKKCEDWNEDTIIKRGEEVWKNWLTRTNQKEKLELLKKAEVEKESKPSGYKN